MTAGPSAGMSAAKRWSHCLFAVLLATSLLLWWHSLTSTLLLALERDAYTHILLIAPLSVALICLDRNTLHVPFERSAGAGTFLLTIGLLMRAVGFPILPRFAFDDPAAETGIRLAASLGQPVILKGHHGDCSKGVDILRQLAEVPKQTRSPVGRHAVDYAQQLSDEDYGGSATHTTVLSTSPDPNS